jgi:hypothetical protein
LADAPTLRRTPTAPEPRLSGQIICRSFQRMEDQGRGESRRFLPLSSGEPVRPPSTAVEWPAGIGAKGNEGVANNTVNTSGAIGYVEFAYAKNGLCQNGQLSRQDSGAECRHLPSRCCGGSTDIGQKLLRDSDDAPGETSWPIAGSTFVLMYAAAQDPSSSSEALKFFEWGYKHGQKSRPTLITCRCLTPSCR